MCYTICHLYPTGQQISHPSGGVSEESVKAYKDMNTFLASFIDHVSFRCNTIDLTSHSVETSRSYKLSCKQCHFEK